MEILIFAVGLVIFITYMYFLIRMINRAHKQQEKEQGRYNYKTNERLGPTKEFVKKHNVKKLKDEEWDS